MSTGDLFNGFGRNVKRFIVAFLLAILVLPAVMLWSDYQIKMLDARIVAVEEARLLTSRALRFAVDQETGMRGYLETNERLFLEPYDSATRDLKGLLAILPARFKEAGFDSALPQLNDFMQLHAAWMRNVANPLLASPQRSDALARQEAGKRLLDKMRLDSIAIHTQGVALVAQMSAEISRVLLISMGIALLWIGIVATLALAMQNRASRNQRALVESLARQHDQLEQLSEWRSRLLAMLAHDFKSQLTVLIGAAHLLEDFPQRRGDPELLASLRTASYSLAEMADNAILLARAQERRIVLQRTTFDISEIVQGVIQRYGTEREFHLHHAMPLAMVDADRSYCSRVLDNIIGNAVKYSELPVHVYVREDDEFISVRVLDRGIGILPDELPHIFEEFWRSDRAMWKRSGSGVGLFIVKTIMEAHGGSIIVESEHGKGTTVTLLFLRAFTAVRGAEEEPLPV